MPLARLARCLAVLAILTNACGPIAPSPAPTTVPDPSPTPASVAIPTPTAQVAPPTSVPTTLPAPEPTPEPGPTAEPEPTPEPTPMAEPEPIAQVAPPAATSPAQVVPTAARPPATKPAGAAPAATKPGARPTAPATTEPPRAPTPAVQPTPVPKVGYLERVPSPSYAVHVFLWGNPETTQRDLRLAKDAGFTHVKQRFEWRNIERDGKGKLEWNEPDRIVNAVAQAGLGIIARVDNQPRWARRDGLFPGTGPPSNLNDWRDYVGQLAARYKGTIGAYEIWNEPNIDREWGDTTPSAIEYTALLKASYIAIKRADPNAIVISAGLSPTTNDGPQARPDGAFLQEMYRAGAADAFDMLGVHAAGFKAEPEADPGDVAASPQLTNGDPSSAELKRAYAFRHVEDVRRIMVEHGDRNKRIAIMEMGWTSDSRPGSPYRWHSVSEEQKGQNIVLAFQLARERWRPWIGYMTLIYLAQPDWTEKDEQYWWSITGPNGAPRPSYHAIKAALR